MKMQLKMHLTDLEWKHKKGGQCLIMTNQKYMEKIKPTKEKCIKRKYWRYRERKSVRIPGIKHYITIRIITIFYLQ
jgi:hypothetical protein